MTDIRPRLIVFSSLFPSSRQPLAGIFIRERMFRVGRILPVQVVSPVPWFPLQSLIRWFRPLYRPTPPRVETQGGFTVHFPRFLSVPGIFKAWDGFFMAACCYPLMRRLRREAGCDLIDAHFGYPDGYAAGLLGRWLGVPVTVTMRGTEVRHSRTPGLKQRLVSALMSATRVISVSESLRKLAMDLGVPPTKVRAIPNGVDLARFSAMSKSEARAAVGVADGVPVLVSVGGLTERKGFHRVIELLPDLRQRFPGLVYLIVGGASAEGDWRARLEQMARESGVADVVRFLGAVPQDRLRVPLSAADVFVLATRNEGWANVFLEAMACGLPVVTTDVGGNREVVSRPDLGVVVPFGKPAALKGAIVEALHRHWDRAGLIAYARDHDWSERVAELVEEFGEVTHEGRPHGDAVREGRHDKTVEPELRP